MEVLLFFGIHFGYMWMIANGLRFFTAILFPKRCMGCKKEGEALCHGCILLCRRALSTPFPFIYTVFDFKEPLIRRSIHAIKYYHRRDLVPPLAQALADEMKKIPDFEKYVLIPIPMSRMRKLMRGHNQAELIAQHVGKELSIPVDTTTLKRVRLSGRQVKTQNRKERLEKQKGSFCAAEDLSGIHVILIDDVTTTGATLREARKVLLSSGAANVLAGTLAH